MSEVVGEGKKKRILYGDCMVKNPCALEIADKGREEKKMQQRLAGWLTLLCCKSYKVDSGGWVLVREDGKLVILSCCYESGIIASLIAVTCCDS